MISSIFHVYMIFVLNLYQPHFFHLVYYHIIFQYFSSFYHTRYQCLTLENHIFWTSFSCFNYLGRRCIDFFSSFRIHNSFSIMQVVKISTRLYLTKFGTQLIFYTLICKYLSCANTIYIKMLYCDKIIHSGPNPYSTWVLISV